MDDIKAIREEIDRIDNSMAALFERRMKLACEIARAKRKGGVPVFAPDREREIVERIAGNADPSFAEDIRQLYAAVFSISKARQRALGARV